MPENDMDMEKKTGKLEKIVRFIERVAQNRLIIAILLVVDGFLFLMNPEQPVEGMGRTLAITMVFAAAVMIFARIVAKERFARFLPALLLLAVGGLMYFFPQALSAYFRLILALLIMMNGIVNLLGVLGVNYSQGVFGTVEGRVRKAVSRVKTTKELDEGFDEQAARYLSPLQRIVTGAKGNKVFFFVLSLLSVLLGLFLLVKPDLAITIFGVIFILVGISDFLLAYRTMKVSEKLHDKRFREILLDGTEEPGKQAGSGPEGGDGQSETAGK